MENIFIQFFVSQIFLFLHVEPQELTIIVVSQQIRLIAFSANAHKDLINKRSSGPRWLGGERIEKSTMQYHLQSSQRLRNLRAQQH